MQVKKINTIKSTFKLKTPDSQGLNTKQTNSKHFDVLILNGAFQSSSMYWNRPFEILTMASLGCLI